MSIWSLIGGASLFVQFIMLVLVLASVLSWAVIVQRFIVITKAKRAQREFEAEFWSGADLREVYSEGAARLADGVPLVGVEAIFRAGFKDFGRLMKRENSKESVIDGTQRAMRIAISHEIDYLEKHLPFLASVASVSPYIGLLGTVWGIMNSFRGLASVHQATLATVAPGIAEALIATAMGLFAAIPAVLAFNRFSADADSLANAYQTFAEELSSVLQRSLPARKADSSAGNANS